MSHVSIKIKRTPPFEFLFGKPGQDIIYEEIDEEIRDVVRLLNEKGIQTYSSCSGHGKRDPFIFCQYTDPLLVAAILCEHNIHSFIIDDSYIFMPERTCLRRLSIKFVEYKGGFIVVRDTNEC